jgi:heme/copper-type cytochrome/quinol oxidase subunit 1
LQRWTFSTNAKDIGTIYLVFSAFSGFLGLAFSIIIRIELSAPGAQLLAGNNQLFNAVITAHGLLMVFFLVMCFSLFYTWNPSKLSIYY